MLEQILDVVDKMYDVIVIEPSNALDYDMTQHKGGRPQIFYASKVITPEMAKRAIRQSYELYATSWVGHRASLPDVDHSFSMIEIEGLYLRGINPVKTRPLGTEEIDGKPVRKFASYVWGAQMFVEDKVVSITSFLLRNVLDLGLLLLMKRTEELFEKPPEVIWHHYLSMRMNWLCQLQAEGRLDFDRGQQFCYTVPGSVTRRVFPDISRLLSVKEEDIQEALKIELSAFEWASRIGRVLEKASI